MKTLFLAIVFLTSLNVHSLIAQQNKGTKIINNLSWAEIKQKAKLEHKHILIDCNSTWCGPCKYLENRVFPLDTIGKLLNPKFLVVSVQFDSSENDNAFVKSWYSTALQFKKAYNVTAFPTEIFLDENANPLAKFTGMDIDNAVAYIYDCIDACFLPKNQYFVLKKKANNVEKMSSYELRILAEASAFSSEMDDYNFYKNKYFQKLTADQFNTKENYSLIIDNLHSTKDSLFNFAIDNYPKIDSIVGSPIATDRISGIVYYDDLKWKKIFKNAGNISAGHYMYVEEPNWDYISDGIDKKYVKLNKDIIYIAKLDFYDLEHLSDKYFDLILLKEKLNKNICQAFTETQIYSFLNKILELKNSDVFWLSKGKNWLNSLEASDTSDKIQRYRSEFDTRLNAISIQK